VLLPQKKIAEGLMQSRAASRLCQSANRQVCGADAKSVVGNKKPRKAQRLNGVFRFARRGVVPKEDQNKYRELLNVRKFFLVKSPVYIYANQAE
jgi:hypothetical protein